MAKLEVELENVSDVFKKKFEKAKDVLNKIEAVVPPEVLKVASQAQKEGKKRLQELSKKVQDSAVLDVALTQFKTLLSDVDQQSEKVLHFFGIPTLKDFNELSKKVDALTKEKKKESVKKQKAS
ncbi:MAG TPA: hypothetical protein VJB34_03020 [Bdellovibrionota bacterium]|nr:hypothetical protein [Bdellovibrionota bacterium]